MITGDGRAVVFWGREPGEVGFNIWRWEASSARATRLTDDRAVTGHPFWTADGQSIIYSSTLGASGETEWVMQRQFDLGRPARHLWIMDADGRHRHELTHGLYADERPCISPDGQDIVFVSNRSGAMNLWQLSLRTGGVAPVTVHAGLDYRPVFSPRGDRLAFFRAVAPDSRHDLCLMNWPAGPAEFPIPRGLFRLVHGPFWLPDGQRLLFHGESVKDGLCALWILDLADRRLTRLSIPGLSHSAHGSVNRECDWLAFDSEDPLPGD